MKERLYLKIITTILLPGLKKEISRLNPEASLALTDISPITGGITCSSAMIIERPAETVRVGFITDSSDSSFKTEFNEWLVKNIRKTEFILKVLTGKEIKRISINSDEKLQGICYRFLIIIHFQGYEHSIEVILESRFFNILYPPFNHRSVHENLLKEISLFFEKPDLLWPSLEPVVELLPVEQLSELFNRIMQKNDISPYQTAAAITLYPHLKEKILASLSANIQKDIEFTINRYRGINSLTRTDGVCAVYTVEEALKNLFQEDAGEYIYNLAEIGEIFRKIKRFSIVLKKDFSQWIDEAEKKNLMHKVISLCDDSVLRRIFCSREAGKELLKKYIPEKRIQEIFAIEENTTLEERIDAETDFVRACRDVLLMSEKKNHESFSFLILSMKGKDDFFRLLSETGWYTLSTALKGADGRIIKKVKDNLPYVPAAIITDILKGKLNPDIIHDEKQIHRARKITVEKIILLYRDCLIDLEY